MTKGICNLMVFALLLAGCREQSAEQFVAKPAPVRFAQAEASPLEHGERLAYVLGCIGCHGEDLAGQDWSEPGFARLWTANLTRAVPRYTDDQLAKVIASGAHPDGTPLWEMPSHLFTALAPEDMAALILFLRSRPPTGVAHPAPRLDEGARREIAAGLWKSSRDRVREEGALSPPDAGAGHALGRHIVRATCAECHGMDLRGGEPHPGAAARPDLRMVAGYEREDFRHLLRTGVAAGGREVGLMSEVARGRYNHLTDDEIDAVHAYLQAVGSQP
ncbi:c-type cytochrome [Allosphingosinicella indica]|uniref:Cytochrome c n=1 Tax=Allosphingosinicella indica TaxID=941907 RepID=A0A1X7GT18_9SPHN|nr:cytochrome c [Allosphingosinicella indica]SMF73554.1 Cytochrome c [Allosphingosinicella indica]